MNGFAFRAMSFDCQVILAPKGTVAELMSCSMLFGDLHILLFMQTGVLLHVRAHVRARERAVSEHNCAARKEAKLIVNTLRRHEWKRELVMVSLPVSDDSGDVFEGGAYVTPLVDAAVIS